MKQLTGFSFFSACHFSVVVFFKFMYFDNFCVLKVVIVLFICGQKYRVDLKPRLLLSFLCRDVV